jgi:hypothetical protein
MRLVKWIGLVVPLSLALLVLVDTPYHRLSLGTLAGVVVPAPAPAFSWPEFFEGRFQTQLEAWLEQELSFKPAMVRTDNTINLLAFGDISAHTRIPIILGKEDTLFETNYVNNTNGVSDQKGDPPPKSAYPLEESVRRLGRAGRAFRALDIDFVVLFYPSKGWIWRDRLPNRYLLPDGEMVAAEGYQRLLTLLRAQGLTVIDGAAVFGALQSEPASFPLYNRGGTHWTDAGACEVARVLTQAISQGRSELRCALGASEIAHATDADLSELINVWSNRQFLDDIPSVRPTLSQPIDGGPLGTLIIGTSFAEHLTRLLRQAGVFGDVNRRQYYRHNNAPGVRWDRELAGRKLVIFEQWQWSYLTVNLTDYLDDLAAHDPRFAAALAAAGQ